MAMRGKCDCCDKKATSEWFVDHGDHGYTLKFCDKHEPKHQRSGFVKIYGKSKKE